MSERKAAGCEKSQHRREAMWTAVRTICGGGGGGAGAAQTFWSSHQTTMCPR